MKHPRTIVAAGVVVVALGATGIASAVGMHHTTTAGATTGSKSALGAVATHVMKSAASSPTIHTVDASVNGKTEAILVNAKGLPLYIYKPDTATKSFVSGGLASLWPPLVSDDPTVVGASGKLSVTRDANGAQVAYNGHFLYTFVSDSAGDVTGQGVQDFFVATPGLTAIEAAAPASVSKSPAPTTASGSGSGWGY
jgi:predicted lipoprotein with Yx(FWY)xxD motif